MVLDVLEPIPLILEGSMSVDERVALSETAESSGGAVLDDKTDRLVASDFLATTSQTVLDQIICRFIDATCNEALKTVACGSCARESRIDECEEIQLNDIPNKHHLIPHVPHPAHELVNGLLFYAPALGSANETVGLCNACRNQLKKDVRPSLSLSNGLWIGDIPRQLQNLTLPERLFC
jgi:hypothetical protein